MKKSYGVNELRRMYLEFFESKGHLAMKSFSLVPHNDNSLLLINAGMAPLKPYFTGQLVILHFLRCSETSRLVIISSMKQSHGHGSF